jgi:cytoskeleton protein RodZ
MKPAKNANTPLLREASETAGSTLGEKLARGRLARGLPVEEVARQMNLSASTIRSLEADNHRGLPGRTFVRGYLRNYARIIGVPVDELVQAYDAQFAEEEEPVTFLAPRRRALRWLGPVIILLGAGILLALLWGLASFITQHWFTVTATAQSIAKPVISSVTRDEEPAGEVELAPMEPLASPVKEVIAAQSGEMSEGPAENAVAQVPVPAAADPGASSAPAPVNPMPALAGGERSETPDGAVVAPVQTTVSSASAVTTPAAVPAQSSRLASAGRGALSFGFSADCWIRVRDATGSNLYRGMMRGGTTLALEGVPPFKVVIGNRTAVTASYNGQPVAIEADPANPVVTLTLGSP